MAASLNLLFWILAGGSAFYLVVPLLIRFQQRFSAHPEVQDLDFGQLEPNVSRFLMGQTDDLRELGFDEPTLVRVPNPVPNVSNHLIMLVNRQRGDKAMVTAVLGIGANRHQSVYVESSTRFDSGEMFDTHNSSVLPAFPCGPRTIRTQAPVVRDARDLYGLHSFVMDKYLPGGRKILYEPGEALDYLARFVFVETYEKQVSRGWLYFDEGLDSYRPTLKGTYLILLSEVTVVD